jgi:ribosomal protein S18 acetylase RimI-like enzyme
MQVTPRRVQAPYDWWGILALLRGAFAYMDGVIDPPSSLHRLTAEDIARQAERGEVWVIGAPPVACMFLTPKGDHLYLGKLAVAADQRGQGLARSLIETALRRAAALGLQGVELETRVELTANHATFRALGFVETGRNAHPGFDRPTSVTFRRAVDRSDQG